MYASSRSGACKEHVHTSQLAQVGSRGRKNTYTIERADHNGANYKIHHGVYLTSCFLWSYFLERTLDLWRRRCKLRIRPTLSSKTF